MPYQNRFSGNRSQKSSQKSYGNQNSWNQKNADGRYQRGRNVRRSSNRDASEDVKYAKVNSLEGLNLSFSLNPETFLQVSRVGVRLGVTCAGKDAGERMLVSWAIRKDVSKDGIVWNPPRQFEHLIRKYPFFDAVFENGCTYLKRICLSGLIVWTILLDKYSDHSDALAEVVPEDVISPIFDATHNLIYCRYVDTTAEPDMPDIGDTLCIASRKVDEDSSLGIRYVPLLWPPRRDSVKYVSPRQVEAILVETKLYENALKSVVGLSSEERRKILPEFVNKTDAYMTPNGFGAFMRELQNKSGDDINYVFSRSWLMFEAGVKWISEQFDKRLDMSPEHVLVHTSDSTGPVAYFVLSQPNQDKGRKSSSKSRSQRKAR